MKVQWVADFKHPNRIPLDKDVLQAEWGWFDTKAKLLTSPNLMAQWHSIESLRLHLNEVLQ